jgi:hypothetical protein
MCKLSSQSHIFNPPPTLAGIQPLLPPHQSSLSPSDLSNRHQTQDVVYQLATRVSERHHPPLNQTGLHSCTYTHSFSLQLLLPYLRSSGRIMQLALRPEGQVQTSVDPGPMVYESIMARGYPFVPVKRVNVNDPGVNLEYEVQSRCVDNGEPVVLEGFHLQEKWDADLFTFPYLQANLGDESKRIANIGKNGPCLDILARDLFTDMALLFCACRNPLSRPTQRRRRRLDDGAVHRKCAWRHSGQGLGLLINTSSHLNTRQPQLSAATQTTFIRQRPDLSSNVAEFPYEWRLASISRLHARQ